MDLISYFRLFYPLFPNESYHKLERLLVSKKFNKGDFITSEGEIQSKLYFVKEGVQMSYFEKEDKYHVIAFTYPPNLCAIPESFFFQSPAKYNLICLENSYLDYITHAQLLDLFNQDREIERLFRIMTEAVLSGVINRYVELHALSIKERYVSFCKRSPHLLKLVPHKYIASYLSINPTNFSKLFNTIKI